MRNILILDLEAANKILICQHDDFTTVESSAEGISGINYASKRSLQRGVFSYVIFRSLWNNLYYRIEYSTFDPLEDRNNIIATQVYRHTTHSNETEWKTE